MRPFVPIFRISRKMRLMPLIEANIELLFVTLVNFIKSYI